jgi:hypothetical protein
MMLWNKLTSSSYAMFCIFVVSTPNRSNAPLAAIATPAAVTTVGTNAGADAAVNTGASAIKMVPETAF